MAWSSAISMLEVVVAWLIDQFSVPRKRAVWLAGGAMWIVGLACAPQPAIFTLLENTTGKFMLPIGGVLVAIGAGGCIDRKDREIGFNVLPRGQFLARVWSVTLKSVTPALVILVLLYQGGLL